MLKLAKLRNRMISIICVIIFAVGVGLVTWLTIKMISDFSKRQDLLQQRDDLLEEKQHQDNLPKDEDYYTVYVKDNYSVYDTEDTIFVFTK